MNEQVMPQSDNALGLGANFTANKAERSAELAGRKIDLELSNGQDFSFEFVDAEKMRWSSRGAAVKRNETYEAQRVADDLFLIAFQHADDLRTSMSVVADLRSGEVVFIQNVVGEKIGNEPAVIQTVTLGRVADQALQGEKIAQTSDLFGRRAMWIYSEDDVYEHIYLNAEWYAWHCLKGEEYPKADIDPCQMFRLREDIYLLTFSEKVMVMAAGMVLDFSGLRSYCAALGRDPATNEITHFTFGAYGMILSQTNYPEPLVKPAALAP
ncbi:MoaF C-terminal domain-containing protein [Rhizobium sp. LEGMi198b]|uniref:MoaF C-terminal domain-containing protein n=1 Tax=unclassified Rhizobium TaxID=2613769 RepID=UPI000CDF4CFA|nr:MULTISPECIES: MoaF C-terminal domain-containing protein [Rhizobium]AVA26618.1 molybdenum cofactor biosynthesis protein F [Rhizobium sp. NXC24]UWU24351.1 molybdenum cofactor biosynthesis F family protein [Rhizobium tropici]